MQACQEHFQDEKVTVLQIPHKIHTLLYIYAFIRIYLSAQLFMCYIIAYFTSTLDKTFDFHNFLLDNLDFLSVIRLPQIILNIIPLIRSINSFGAWGEMLRPNLITHIYSYCI